MALTKRQQVRVQYGLQCCLTLFAIIMVIFDIVWTIDQEYLYDAELFANHGTVAYSDTYKANRGLAISFGLVVPLIFFGVEMCMLFCGLCSLEYDPDESCFGCLYHKQSQSWTIWLHLLTSPKLAWILGSLMFRSLIDESYGEWVMTFLGVTIPTFYVVVFVWFHVLVSLALMTLFAIIQIFFSRCCRCQVKQPGEFDCCCCVCFPQDPDTTSSN